MKDLHYCELCGFLSTLNSQFVRHNDMLLCSNCNEKFKSGDENTVLKIKKKSKLKNMTKLSERIFAFIDKYAGISPNYKGEGDNKYTSPDAYQLISCAEDLKAGIKPIRCFSEWGSGGYKPYSSKEGRKEHDELVAEIYHFINHEI